MHAALADAVRAGLVFRLEDAYRFSHDRIQQAAYALIPEVECADIHLRIGQPLLAGMTADAPAEPDGGLAVLGLGEANVCAAGCWGSAKPPMPPSPGPPT